MTDTWRVRRVDDLAEIYDGPHATPHKTQGGPWFLSISSLQRGRLVIEESAHLSEDDFVTWTRRVTPRPGDVLFSYETRLGEAALMPVGLRACLGRRMGILRPRADEVNSRFLLYAYLAPAFQSEIERRAVRGATVDRIPLVELGRWPILVPDRPTQDGIAEVLGALDDKIEMNDVLIGRLKSMSAVLFEQFSSNAETCTDIELLPLGALSRRRFVKTGPFGSNLHASDYAEKGTPLILVKHVVDGMVLRDGLPLVSLPKTQELSDYLLLPDDIVVTRVGRVGDAAIIHDRQSGWLFSGQMLRVRLPPKSLEPYWLFGFMLTKAFRKQIDNFAVGSTRQSLSVQLLEAIKVPIVPEVRQIHFANVVRPLWQYVESLTGENEQLRSLRDALLPRLLSGQLRIGDPEP